MAATDKPVGRQLGWTLIDTRYIYEGRWFKVRKDVLVRDGHGQTTYTYLEHPGSVFVVPLTRDRRVVLIRSYRFTVDTWCWEVPAGTMADREGLSPEAVALEELHEEIGATCGSLKDLGGYYLGNGYGSHRARFFLAVDAEPSTRSRPDPFEQIAEVVPFSLADVERLIREGGINDGDSAFALLLALNQLASETRES